jgi:hypothetical protein
MSVTHVPAANSPSQTSLGTHYGPKHKPSCHKQFKAWRIGGGERVVVFSKSIGDTSLALFFPFRCGFPATRTFSFAFLSASSSTLPSPTLPGGVQADSMDSVWIPHGFQVKCPKKEIFTLESMLILGSFLVESRTRISVIICMDSTQILDRITQKKKLALEIQVDYMESMQSVWIPHGFQAKLSKGKNPIKSKKNSKKCCDHECIRIMILCYAKMKSAANIYAVNNQ